MIFLAMNVGLVIKPDRLAMNDAGVLQMVSSTETLAVQVLFQALFCSWSRRLASGRPIVTPSYRHIVP
jgi:hypothetical protein